MGLARAGGVLAFAAASAFASGCFLLDSFATNEFSGDEFPILVDTSSGAIVMGMRQAGADDRTAIVDVMSPLTFVDPGLGAQESVANHDVTLLGVGATGVLDLPRAVLRDAQLVSRHPCGTLSTPIETCEVGPAASPRAFDAIVGANVLAGDALRLRLGEDTMFLLPDIGGDGEDRTGVCDAVFATPYRGGGTLTLSAGEVPFVGRRIKIDACLGANAEYATPQGYRGADVMFIASTSIGPTLLSEAAYRRYVRAVAGRCANGSEPCATPYEELGEETVNLPNGPVTGRSAVIANLTLTAQSGNPSRAACRHVYANHFLEKRNCLENEAECPCDDNSRFCASPALVELTAATGFPVIVLPDGAPVLHALSTELRPTEAEVDGILGTSAMRSLELDIDYPHNRVLARCRGDGCVVRPRIAEEKERTQAQLCLRSTPPGPVYP